MLLTKVLDKSLSIATQHLPLFLRKAPPSDAWVRGQFLICP